MIIIDLNYFHGAEAKVLSPRGEGRNINKNKNNKNKNKNKNIFITFPSRIIYNAMVHIVLRRKYKLV